MGPVLISLMLISLFIASFVLLAQHEMVVAAGTMKRLCKRIFTCKKQTKEESDPLQLPRWRARIQIAVIRCQQVFFNIVFILYPSICSKIFLVWKCDSIGTKRYLSKDLEVECDTEKHNAYQWWAVVFFCIYVVGIPAVLMFNLWFARKTIINNPADPIVYAKYKGLYAQYEPRYWWFELVQMLRKMLLTGGLLLINQGSTQILVGVIVCLAYMMFFVNTAPFIHDDEDALEQVASVQLFVSLLLGLVISLRAEVKAASNQVMEPDSVMDNLLIFMNMAVIVMGVVTIIKSFSLIRKAFSKTKEQTTLKKEADKADKAEKQAEKAEKKAKKTKKAKKLSKGKVAPAPSTAASVNVVVIPNQHSEVSGPAETAVVSVGAVGVTAGPVLT